MTKITKDYLLADFSGISVPLLRSLSRGVRKKYLRNWRRNQLRPFLLAAQKGRCYVCGMEINSGATVDHITPVARGGTDTPPNYAVAHGHCNGRKGSRMPYACELMYGRFLAAATSKVDREICAAIQAASRLAKKDCD